MRVWMSDEQRMAQPLQVLRGLGFFEFIGQGNQRSVTP